MSNSEIMITAIVLVILFLMAFDALMGWLETKFDQYEEKRKKSDE